MAGAARGACAASTRAGVEKRAAAPPRRRVKMRSRIAPLR